MRKLMLTMVCGFTLFSVAVPVQSGTLAESTSERPSAGPLEQRLRVINALKANDGASLIEAIGGEAALSAFLSEGASETEASLAAKMAEGPKPQSQQDVVQLWTTLAGADGVNQASAMWYPRWQAYLPQALAGAQMGLLALGSSAAESTSMTALERAQLNELQWALGGWLSRTDFADRKHFNQLLGLARSWIVSSGKAHPTHLALTKPEQRLHLLDQAIASGKQALGLYGLDVNAALASVQMEQLEHNDERARIRTAFNLLNVPLVFEEDLRWYDGEWRDAAEAQLLEGMVSEDVQEAPAAAQVGSAAPLGDDPVFTAPPAPQAFEKTGCHAPE